MADASAGNNAGSTSNAEVQIQIPAGPPKAEPGAPSKNSGAKNWRWWMMVSVDVFFVVAGQTSATLLGRYYYHQGGSSNWISMFVQTAGFPILFLALLCFPKSSGGGGASGDAPVAKVAVIYVVLGLVIAADDMMYASGLKYLPVSTYSLICASQLAFNVIFSYVLNSQKLTGLIFNAVILLTLSDALLGVNHDETEDMSGMPRGKYLMGFLLTLGASGTYSLILSLMQLTFENVIKKHTYMAVLNMQIYMALVATIASMVGLFASGEWRMMTEEMDTFRSGQFSYFMTLVWTAVSWQITSVGVVGLVFEVSSLFSNVICTVSLPIVPPFAVLIFHDTMDGIKIISMLIAAWGFVSYLMQHFIDDKKARKAAAGG
ncbi:unnamed protein product [Triticum turgidum subsp. durum]|uniref:Probable purine permease n=1 Tax=Triticum turgidum subsp. durum TaxID=4567 RepID=A0A9R0U1C7_TRITD|nr:unnamed protein product [Triticum turgidum subsp. durum]